LIKIELPQRGGVKVEFWEILQDLMEKNNDTVSTVSKGTGLPYTTVDAMIKNRAQDISMSRLHKLAQYFGKDMEYFVSGDDSKYRRVYVEDELSVQLMDKMHKQPNSKVLFSTANKVKPKDFAKVEKLLQLFVNGENNE
jgi:plasmid maintenance system antidote protein VapI